MKSKLLVILTSPLTGAKCEVKAMSIFDLAFDSNQRCGKAVTYLTLPLTWVKIKSKLMEHLTLPLTCDKGLVKATTYLIRL